MVKPMNSGKCILNMIEDTKSEGDNPALRNFNFANEMEKIHTGLYKKALENLNRDEEVHYYVCQACGNTIEGEPHDNCPICGAKKEMFKRID